MVDFVLQGHGQQVFGLQGDFFLVERPGADLDFGGPFDLGGVINDAETAFFPHHRAFPGGDTWIDQPQQLLAGLVMIHVKNDNTLGCPELGGGQTHTRRVIHGFHHVFDQARQLTVHVLDRRRGFGQAQVWKMQNVSYHQAPIC